MSLTCAIEPAEDLELYLGYGRPAGKYADYAEIRRRLAAVAPHFDFEQALTGHARILSVRDAQAHVRAMAVLADESLRLYYADDPASTQCLMRFIDGGPHGQPAPNS